MRLLILQQRTIVLGASLCTVGFDSLLCHLDHSQIHQTGQNNLVNVPLHQQLLHMMPLNTWKLDSTMPSGAMNT